MRGAANPSSCCAFAVLAVRGFLYTLSDNSYWLVGVQLLEGSGPVCSGRCFPSSSRT